MPGWSSDGQGHCKPSASILAYLKTHNYHWNVTGPIFTTLYTMFETQYTELALAVDEIAERIRALDAYAPGSYAEFTRLSAVKDEARHPLVVDMIPALAADQRLVETSARAVIRAAEAADDQASADLGTRRLQIHEKNGWGFAAIWREDAAGT